jgi:hypothetical protein
VPSRVRCAARSAGILARNFTSSLQRQISPLTSPVMLVEGTFSGCFQPRRKSGRPTEGLRLVHQGEHFFRCRVQGGAYILSLLPT